MNTTYGSSAQHEYSIHHILQVIQLVQHLVYLPLLLHHLLLLPLPIQSYRLSHTPQKWSSVYLNGYESPIMSAEEGFMDEEEQVGSSWCGVGLVALWISSD